MWGHENLYPYLKEVTCLKHLFPIIVTEGKYSYFLFLLFHGYRNFSCQYSFAGIAIIKEMMSCENPKAKVSFCTFLLFYSKYCHCLKIQFVDNSVKVTSENCYSSPLIHLWWSSLLLTISTSSLVSSCCDTKFQLL